MQVDQQLFVGFEAYPSVYDIIDTLVDFTTEAASKIQRAIDGSTSIVIVFSVSGHFETRNLRCFGFSKENPHVCINISAILVPHVHTLRMKVNFISV